jgi:hypothetical protein
LAIRGRCARSERALKRHGAAPARREDERGLERCDHGRVASVEHRREMTSALELEAQAQRLALAGASGEACRTYLAAADRYRASWELASATSYGRLVGMLKAAIIAGQGEREAAYARRALEHSDADSPTAAYARALAALVAGEDAEAVRWAGVIAGASDAFDRAARAIVAIATRDQAAYALALAEIVRDFERRPEHLTGVPIADTALMFERLAAPRGMSAGVASPLLPVL